MATTVISGFPEGMLNQAYKWYWDSYDPLSKVYPEIFKVERVTEIFTKSTSAVGSGLIPEKAENAALSDFSPIEGYTVYGMVRGNGQKEKISRELKDDFQKLSNFLESQMPDWTEAVVKTLETFYAGVFNYGGYTTPGHDVFKTYIANTCPGYTTDGLIYDGKPLFALSGNNHVSKGGGTYYNGLALGVSKANLQTAHTLFTVTNNRMENDTRMSLKPDVILANDSMKWTIDELLNSQDDPTTSNRAINVMKGLYRPIYWQYLTDTNQWTILKARFGMKALMRLNPEFDMWEDKDKKAHYLSIYFRYGLEVSNWRGVVSSNFSTSA